jgi:hypothetical protein
MNALVRPFSARPARFRQPSVLRLPPVAQTGDANRWVTGHCWLWCDRDCVQVVWIGPASVQGHTAHMYACEACLRSLADRIIATRTPAPLLEGLDCPDEAVRSWPTVHGPPAGRHRRLP